MSSPPSWAPEVSLDEGLARLAEHYGGPAGGAGSLTFGVALDRLPCLEPEERLNLDAQALVEVLPEVLRPESACWCAQDLVDVGPIAVLRHYP